jgi:hypothetical protein
LQWVSKHTTWFGSCADELTSAVHIPAADIGAGSSWSILEDVIGDPAEIAYYIVKDGPSKALSQVPIAWFRQPDDG